MLCNASCCLFCKQKGKQKNANMCIRPHYRSGVSASLFRSWNREIETGSIHQHILTVYTLTIMGSVGIPSGFHCRISHFGGKNSTACCNIFLSKRWNYRTEAMIGTPDGSVN